MVLKDTGQYTYHDGLSRFRGRQRARYIEFYNRGLDMWLSCSYRTWPPSEIDIHGDEFIASADMKPLERAVGDVVRDIYVAECALRPRWYNLLSGGGGEHPGEAFRLWKMDGKENDACAVIATLKIQSD